MNLKLTNAYDAIEVKIDELQDETFQNLVRLSFLKGPCREIFDLCFFSSSNNSIWALAPRVKAFLHMTLYSRR
jgi:hypothetical protein